MEIPDVQSVLTLDVEEVRSAYLVAQPGGRFVYRERVKYFSVRTVSKRLFSKRVWRRLWIELRRSGGVVRVFRFMKFAIVRGISASLILDDRLVLDPPMVSTHGPLISVVIPVFNKGLGVVRAVESVLRQSLTNWELIVWDDGSSDEDTRKALESISRIRDPRIRIIHESNQGVVRARNSALQLAQGTYVVFLDADDRILPTYLEKACLALEGNPAIDICTSRVRLVGHPTESTWIPESLSWPEISLYNQLPISSMIRMKIVKEAGGFRDEMSLGWEDWDLWLRLAAQGARSTTLDEELFEYTYSDVSGRDATSAKENESLLRAHLGEVSRRGNHQIRGTLPRTSTSGLIRSFNRIRIPGEKHSIVFFVPWILRGGGADAFIVDLASGLKSLGYECIFVLTEEAIPEGAIDGYQQISEIAPNSYRLKDFLHLHDWSVFIEKLLQDLEDPTLICMGSRFFYDFAASQMNRGIWNARAIDILFNPIGHLPRHSEVQKAFSDVVFAYSGLEGFAISTRSISGKSHVVPVGIAPGYPFGNQKKLRFVIGWLGRFSTEKRPDWFLRLAQEIGEPTHFVMAGTGPLLDECKQKARAIKNLELRGFVEDAQEFYSEIDLLVISSEIEGISVTAMEALRAGVPVVSTDVGGMSDLIEDGRNGYLVSPHKPHELFAVVDQLVRNRNDFLEVSDFVQVIGLPPRFELATMISSYVEIVENSRKAK